MLVLGTSKKDHVDFAQLVSSQQKKKQSSYALGSLLQFLLVFDCDGDRVLLMVDQEVTISNGQEYRNDGPLIRPET